MRKCLKILNYIPQSTFVLDDFARFAAIVADGMGGHEGGEFASELAAQAFDDFVQGLQDDLSSDEVIASAKEWAETTHRMITAKSIEMPQYHGMGTTVWAPRSPVCSHIRVGYS